MIVGLTGGIGSGKSTVAGMFKDLGVPIYMADRAGRELLEESSAVRKKVIALLGEEAYHNQRPDRAFIASVVFKDEKMLKALNRIIHPAVKKHFEAWIKVQNYPYVIKEAAILFESGSYKDCNAIITVVAPEDVRIERTIQRDGVTEKEVRARMKYQWEDDKRIALSNYVIYNLSLNETREQVENIHHELIKKLS